MFDSLRVEIFNSIGFDSAEKIEKQNSISVLDIQQHL